MKRRKLLLTGSSLLAVVVGMSQPDTVMATTTTISTSITSSQTITGSADTLSITNTGAISGVPTDVVIRGTGGTLINDGVLTGSGRAVGMTSGVTLDSVVNTGSMTGSSAYGIANDGSLGSINNSGRIVGGIGGIATDGTIGTLTNSGTISAQYGIYNLFSGVSLPGLFRVINNSGTITGSIDGIYNTGTIGTLINSGLVTGTTYALYNGSTGTIGPISNGGTIAGNILNLSTNALSFAGASDSSFGTLTGKSGTVGTITSTLSNLTFASGNILLNDNINVGAGHTVTSGATLQFSNPISITGNYAQSGGGLVIVTSNGGTSYGSLSVSGTASVTSATITISGSGLTTGEVFIIVNPSGTGTYSNNTLTISGTSGLSGTIATVGNLLEVVLGTQTITPTTPPTITPPAQYVAKGNAAGGAAVGVGPALDAIAASTSPVAVAFQNGVLAPLNALPIPAQQEAIKQLAPTQLTPAVQAAIQATAPTTSAIEQHELASLGDGGAGAAAGSPLHAYGLWGQILGGMALRSNSAVTDGFKSNNFGLVSGLDYHVDDETMLGAALSWVRGWSWGLGGATGSFATIDSYQLNGYGLHRWGPAFIDGQVGFGYNNFSQRRAIGFINQMAHASYDGQQYLAKLGVGYDVLVERVTLTPLAGLRFLRAVSDSYTETGSAENLAIRRRGVQSLTQDLGAKVSWDIETAFGDLKPEARLAWVHDYTQGPIATSGIMGGETPFTSATARPAADGARLVLAATLEKSDNLSFRVEYEGELRPNYESHAGLLKVTWGF